MRGPTVTRVLLVEDDPSLRSMLANLLEDHNYLPLEADTRQHALTQMRHEPPLALIDLGLPPQPYSTEEGMRLVTELLGKHPDLKVIVLSGQDQHSASLAAIRAGAFDFLAKPIGSEDLLRAVERASLFAAREKELHAEGISRISLQTRPDEGLKAARDGVEEQLLRQALHDNDFNITQTARSLGVQRENMYYLLKKYGIKREP